MGEYRVIGVVGRPHNSAGWLTPILMNKENLCFRLGDSKQEGASLSEIEDFARDGSAILFRSGESALSVSLDSYQRKVDLPAYVYYQSLEAMNLLSQEDQSGCAVTLSSCDIEELSPVCSEEARFKYYFIKNNTLKSDVLPQLFRIVRASCFNFLVDHVVPSGFDSEVMRQFSDLTDLLSDLVSNKESAEEAILYSGLALWLGPNARNFPVWLHTALWHFQIPLKDEEHWLRKCRGILHDAHARACKKATAEKYFSVFSNPVIAEHARRSADTVQKLYEDVEEILNEPESTNMHPEMLSIESRFGSVKKAKFNR